MISPLDPNRSEGEIYFKMMRRLPAPVAVTGLRPMSPEPKTANRDDPQFFLLLGEIASAHPL